MTTITPENTTWDMEPFNAPVKYIVNNNGEHEYTIRLIPKYEEPCYHQPWKNKYKKRYIK